MKRIVVLIDGTWNKEGTVGDTNVAKFDSTNPATTQNFIKELSSAGTPQHVHYHDGVGTEGDFFKRFLGGAIGFGLKKIIQDCYGFLAADYDPGDEIYLIGFSRGAYASRALAGLIGASGIPRRGDAPAFEIAWNHYRNEAGRPQSAGKWHCLGSEGDRGLQYAFGTCFVSSESFHQMRCGLGYRRFLRNSGRVRSGGAREILHALEAGIS